MEHKLTGQDIATMRRRAGLSQAELARRLSFSRQYLCNIERGRRDIPYTQTARILNTLLAAHHETERSITIPLQTLCRLPV